MHIPRWSDYIRNKIRQYEHTTSNKNKNYQSYLEDTVEFKTVIKLIITIFQNNNFKFIDLFYNILTLINNYIITNNYTIDGDIYSNELVLLILDIIINLELNLISHIIILNYYLITYDYMDKQYNIDTGANNESLNDTTNQCENIFKNFNLDISLLIKEKKSNIILNLLNLLLSFKTEHTNNILVLYKNHKLQFEQEKKDNITIINNNLDELILNIFDSVDTNNDKISISRICYQYVLNQIDIILKMQTKLILSFTDELFMNNLKLKINKKDINYQSLINEINSLISVHSSNIINNF
tara:strand:- start:506 stop:1396 length:891 start_codon:yes stop_codon:yes gene_type:complete